MTLVVGHASHQLGRSGVLAIVSDDVNSKQIAVALRGALLDR
jgi:hypothetical protein